MVPSRRTVLRTVAAAAAVGVAGCSSSCPDEDAPEPETLLSARDAVLDPFEAAPSGDWPAPRYGPANRGYAPEARPAAGSVGVRWRTGAGPDDPEAGGASSPTVADGRVFVAHPDGVDALNLADGSRAWRSTGVDPAVVPSTFEYDEETAPPVVARDGSVLVGGTDAVTALDPADGSVRWSYDRTAPFSIPAAGDDAVYVATESEVVALDAGDGEERWRREVTLDSINLPAVGEGTVVVSDIGRTRALAAATGEERWRADPGAEEYPVVADGTVYLGGFEGLRALSLSDGSPLWTFERGSGRAISAPVVAPEALYVVEQPGEGPAATFALNRTDGKPSPRWCSYVADGAATGAAGDQAYVVRPGAGFGPDPTPSLVAFTDRFGDAVWGYATGDRLLPPAVLDGAVVLTDRRGNVAAVGEV